MGAIAPLPISKIIAGRNADGIRDLIVIGREPAESAPVAITIGSGLRYASAVSRASRLRYASAVSRASRLRYASAVSTARSFVDNSNIAVRGYDDRLLGRRTGGGRGVLNAAFATYHRADTVRPRRDGAHRRSPLATFGQTQHWRYAT